MKLADVLKAAGRSQDQVAANLAALQSTQPQLFYTAERNFRDAARRAYVTLHPPTQAMLATANMLAARNEPVLINGPTGTGKELVAKIIHAKRAASSMPPVEMVSINCAGLPEGLFESLVFGHTKGSFTGSIGDTVGLLRSAKGSTAFFDEVGELPLPQQAKLLRVLATNKVRPVGATEEYDIDCRFVFATHRDLKGLVRSGKFREDLYYRISPAVLVTYALSHREMDLIPIAEHILASFGIDRSVAHAAQLTPDTYSDGNVRQLYNYLYRRYVLGLDHSEAIVNL